MRRSSGRDGRGRTWPPSAGRLALHLWITVGAYAILFVVGVGAEFGGALMLAVTCRSIAEAWPVILDHRFSPSFTPWRRIFQMTSLVGTHG